MNWKNPFVAFLISAVATFPVGLLGILVLASVGGSALLALVGLALYLVMALTFSRFVARTDRIGILIGAVTAWNVLPLFLLVNYAAYAWGGTSAMLYASVPFSFSLVGLGLVLAQRNGSGHALVLGVALLTLFSSERGIGDESLRLGVSMLAVLSIALLALLRFTTSHASTDVNRGAHRIGLGALGLVGAGLLGYALTFDAVTTSVFSDPESQSRWQGAVGSIWPIFVLAGFVPTVLLDVVVMNHPVRVPRGAARGALTNGLSAALGIALIFPVNYIAARNEVTYDVAYFRTTRAGTSTQAVVTTLPEAVEATLFFANGSDVGREVEPYFESLAELPGSLLRYTLVDQALMPELAEELKIRDNGYVVLKMGDSVEKFKIGTELRKAKRELKKLDETVQKHLLKVSKGQRRAYFVVGHGEANFRERDNQLRKLNLFKKVLESQNFKVSNLGVAEGLANTVPDDADLLVVAAPEKPLMPEEIESITAFLDGGGAALIMADPGGDPMDGLMEHLGLELGTAPLAHATAHVRQSNSIGDRILIATNRYGSHSSVKTLSKNGTTMAMVAPSVVSIEKVGTPPGKVSTLIRSFPDTWPDAPPGNRRKDGDEVGKVWDIAVASTGPETQEAPWRAIVLGDVNWASDPVLQYSQANQVFSYDAVRWLVGDDAIQGEVNNEEDVKIQHTRDEDWAWFVLTILGVPFLVFASGMLFVIVRRMR